MPDMQRSPVLALAREILVEQKVNVGLAAAFLALAAALKQFGDDSVGIVMAGNVLMSLNTLVLTFMIFTRTESNPRRDRRGFPARYFTLPVSTLTLVIVPLVMGVVTIELVFGAFLLFDLVLVQPISSAWMLFKAGSFMLTYQMLLWCAARLGAARMIVIGLLSFIYIVLPPLPVTIAVLGVWTIAAFLLSWFGVARQRSGANHGGLLFAALRERLASLLPQRKSRFTSIQQAQTWYEWRKVGYLLPVIVATVLLTAILPMSLAYPGLANVVLTMTLLMPVLLAAPIGKAFSKADTWSMDASLGSLTESARPLAVPPFLAVRPLAAHDVVAAKLRAAALSTALAWAVALVFLAFWMPAQAYLSVPRALGRTLWAMQGHSLLPQFALAALLLVFLMLVTWRFLVAGIWIGLSGSGRLFTASTVMLAVVPAAGILAVGEYGDWLRDDHDRLVPLVGVVGLLVAMKFWLAAFIWRGVSPVLTRRYVAAWACGTLCMLVFALLAAEPVSFIFNSDLGLVRNLLVFAALMVLPLAQIGLAPRQFAANRHR
jgi:hypothetical protein